MAIYFRTPNGNVRQASTIHMNVGNNAGEKRIQSIYYGVGAGKGKQIYEGDTVALLNVNYNYINNISLNQKEIPANATLVVSHPNSKYKIYATGNTTGINNNGFGNLRYANLYTKAKKIEIVSPENNYKLTSWVGFYNSNLSYCIENLIFNGCILPNTTIFSNIKELYGNADKFKCYIIGLNNNFVLNLGQVNNGSNLYGNLRLKAQNIRYVYGNLLNSNNINFFAEIECSHTDVCFITPIMSVNKGDINLKFNNVDRCQYIFLRNGSYQNFTLTLNWDTQNSSLYYIPWNPPVCIGIFSNFKLIGNEAKIYLNCKKILDFTYSNTQMHFLGPCGVNNSSEYYWNFYGNFSSNFNNKIYIYCNNFTIANKIMQKTLYGFNYSYSINTGTFKRNTNYLESFSPITDAEIYRPDDINKTQPYFGNGNYGAYRSNRLGICVFYDYLE